jgi:sigma-E factor negative regulatory protein RseB
MIGTMNGVQTGGRLRARGDGSATRAAPSQAPRLGPYPPRLALATLFSCLSMAIVAAESCPELDPGVHRILEAMASTAARGVYSGVVTLQRGNDMQVVQVSRQVKDGQATEVLAPLTGQDAQILRIDHPTDCVHPGHRLLQSRGASTAAGEEGEGGGVCGLALSYRFDLGPGERIAGREAVRLRVEPRDMYRFGYVFELDADTALMLKATTLGADSRVLEEFQFASLDMEDGAAKRAPLEHRADHPHPQDRSRPRVGPAWSVGWLPSGFLATDAVPEEAQRKSFTDGLATFSVFLEPLGVAIKPGEGVERQGSTVAYTRGVQLREQPMLVTVLGEIPTNTARMVADSVRLQ